MKKINILKHFRFTCLMVAVMLLCTLPITAKADGSGMVEPVYCTDGTLYPITDAADLLTDDEEQALADRIYAIEAKYNSTIVFLTVKSLGNRTVTEYADDFYDYNGYGMGERHNGIILLLAMDTREWHIGTTGSAIAVYSDSDQENMIGACFNDLSTGNYYSAFNTFVTRCAYELQSDAEFHSFSFGKFLICLVIGLVLSFITILFLLGQLKTVHPQSGASNYTQQGLKLTSHSDRFLRKSLVRTAIPKDNGGSSTHSGSSGTSHGGSSGHF